MNKTYQEVCDELQAANEHIAALSAHLQRLNSHARCAAEELALMIDKHNVQSNEDGSWLYDHQTPFELMAVIRAAPDTSLARNNARVAAASLERFMGLYLEPGLAHNRATGELETLRKQAEEL